MSAPKKAIFARTQPQARSYGRAFELSPEEWSSFGMNAAMPSGRRFDRIVVILPADVTSREMAAVVHIQNFLADDGEIGLISPHDAPVVIPQPARNPGDADE